jgi:hypothetical protein
MLYSYFIIGNAIVSLIPLILFVVPVRNDEDGFFALYIFDNWFPDYNVVLNWIYRSTFPVLAYAMICGPNILLYTTEQNQTEVEHRIKFCIKRHIEIIKWVSSNVQFIFYHKIYYCAASDTLTKFRNWILIFAIVVVPFFLSCTVYFFLVSIFILIEIIYRKCIL